jgi:hypothetical protein
MLAHASLADQQPSWIQALSGDPAGHGRESKMLACGQHNAAFSAFRLPPEYGIFLRVVPDCHAQFHFGNESLPSSRHAAIEA